MSHRAQKRTLPAYHLVLYVIVNKIFIYKPTTHGHMVPCLCYISDFRWLYIAGFDPGALSKRFGAKWRLVVLHCGQTPKGQVQQNSPQSLQIFDTGLFHQHLLTANLYVFWLAWSKVGQNVFMAFCVLYCCPTRLVPDMDFCSEFVAQVSLVPSSSNSLYAFELGIPSLLTGEHSYILRDTVDGYVLKSAAAIPEFLDKMNLTELESVGIAARESSYLRFSKFAARPRVSLLMDSISIKATRPTRIALFLQMHNASLWSSLYECMENVFLAAEKHRSVDLFIITTSEESAATLTSLAKTFKSFSSLRYLVVAVGKNKGADIGLFLQQLVMNVELQLDVDIILKLHSKRKPLWRSLLVDSLCGSVEVVRRHLDALEADPMMAMIGPSKLTWGPDSQSFIAPGVLQKNTSFSPLDLAFMKNHK